MKGGYICLLEFVTNFISFIHFHQNTLACEKEKNELCLVQRHEALSSLRL